MPGFAAEIRQALAERVRWLAGQQFADIPKAGEVAPKPNMIKSLRQRELNRVAADVSRRLGASFIPSLPGERISGVYDGVVATPTGKLAVIRREDTFTLAPWRPALDPFRGRTVMGLARPNRVTWTLDRGRAVPPRA